MKSFVPWSVFALVVSMLFGCSTASKNIQSRWDPPDEFNAFFLKYKALPGEKMLVLAVDPNGGWASGFDYDCNTLQEAAENATARCNECRKKMHVFTKARVFAINNEVVYHDHL